MDASIVVCTYNRAGSLHDTLRALRALTVPQDRRIEVIVVDNNSRDDTRAVVEGFAAEWPVLRYAFEPQQGLSHARNLGISLAQGEIVLFTDDDVLPEADWLEVTLQGMQRFKAAACGGYIAPIWETPPPAWLTERFYGFLAVRVDRTDDYVMTGSDQTPFGANMAFRRSVFDIVGRFDTNRGRKGAVLASGEDGEMFERIRAHGLTIAFLGGSRVHHKVEAFRCTRRYFRRWRRHTSKNLAIAKGVPGTRRVLNVPLYLFPQLARALLRCGIGYAFLAADEAMNRDVVLHHFLGTMQGLFQIRKVGPNT